MLDDVEDSDAADVAENDEELAEKLAAVATKV